MTLLRCADVATGVPCNCCVLCIVDFDVVMFEMMIVLILDCGKMIYVLCS